MIPIIMSLHAVLPTSPETVNSKIGQLIRILRHLSATENVESTVLLLPKKLAKATPHHHNHVRGAPSEETLDLPNFTPAARPAQTSQLASKPISNFTVPSNLPACFTSLGACNNQTNSCSGHGSCYKARDNCYKCKCGATVARVNEDGSQKTVQWGGVACEKKDISVPFILFASFGVVMAALIAGAIGMLYKMGSQELPSVIGAGVAGPRSQK